MQQYIFRSLLLLSAMFHATYTVESVHLDETSKKNLLARAVTVFDELYPGHRLIDIELRTIIRRKSARSNPKNPLYSAHFSAVYKSRFDEDSKGVAFEVIATHSRSIFQSIGVTIQD